MLDNTNEFRNGKRIFAHTTEINLYLIGFGLAEHQMARFDVPWEEVSRYRNLPHEAVKETLHPSQISQGELFGFITALIACDYQLLFMHHCMGRENSRRNEAWVVCPTNVERIVSLNLLNKWRAHLSRHIHPSTRPVITGHCAKDGSMLSVQIWMSYPKWVKEDFPNFDLPKGELHCIEGSGIVYQVNIS
jgi:hypothetical protein